MRVLHFSYAQVAQPYLPQKWLDKIIFSIGVLESMTRNAEVTGIYHIQSKGSLARNGVKYYFTDLGKWQLLFPFRFNFFIRKLDPDVIILHGLIFPWQVLLLWYQLKRKPIIIAQHHAERPFKDFRKYLQLWADRYIAAYLFSGIELGKLWVDANQICNSSKIKIVMGTSSPFFRMSKVEARNYVPVSGDLNYLWVGDLTPNKDPLLAVAVFTEFLKHTPEANFWMIYRASYLEPEVKLMIESSKVQTSIHLVGKVEHDWLLYWFNSLDFIISCSHYEGSGIAVCEAMSCGCIPILTSIPSFKMMTNDGETGLHFNPGDREGLLLCLIKSLELNNETEKEKVRTRFDQELSFDANARKIMKVINEVERQ